MQTTLRKELEQIKRLYVVAKHCRGSCDNNSVEIKKKESQIEQRIKEMERKLL